MRPVKLMASGGLANKNKIAILEDRKLSADERREEIARMLSGASITEEARAQAAKLLEAA